MRNALFIILIMLAMFMTSQAFGRTITLDEDVVTIRTDINYLSVSKAMLRIQRVDKDVVTMYISSPGGSVLSGMKFIRFMKSSGKRFVCIADFAASMAFSIFQQCDVRYITNSGILMQHQSSWGVAGKDRENKALIKMITEMNEVLEESTATKLKMSVKEYRDLIAHDYWVFGNRAASQKMAMAAIDVQCKPSLYKRIVKDTIQTNFGAIPVEWNGCPLIDVPMKVDGNTILHKSEWDTKYIKKINKVNLNE